MLGAGTSARIGVQDGSELFPTFGWPKSRVKFIIAGGKKALLKSIENAEDDIEDAKLQCKSKSISSSDVVIGLSASGSTPFTNEVLKIATKIGACTIGITNNEKTSLEKFSKFCLVLNTGGELIGGSTRLKAGTSQKIILNIISTLLFSKLGYVKDGLMVNLKPTNKKLVLRKIKIKKSFYQKQINFNFKNEKDKIVIIGLGYVGSTLAIRFSKYYEVIGFDNETDKIKNFKSKKF